MPTLSTLTSRSEGLETIRSSNVFVNGIPPDVIVCSDCLYDSSSALALLGLLEEVCGPNTQVLVCNPLRSVFDEFLSYARRSSFYTHGQEEKGEWEIEELSLTLPEYTIYRGTKGIFVAPPVRFLIMRFVARNRVVKVKEVAEESNSAPRMRSVCSRCHKEFWRSANASDDSECVFHPSMYSGSVYF